MITQHNSFIVITTHRNEVSVLLLHESQLSWDSPTDCFLSSKNGIFRVIAAADFQNLPSSCTQPSLCSHMMFLPLTYNNLPSQDSLKTHVIRVSETCWQLIFKRLAPAGIGSVKVARCVWGGFLPHLGASRVGLPSCSDIMPRVSWWECESSIHMIC